jgi:hypothetical protein
VFFHSGLSKSNCMRAEFSEGLPYGPSFGHQYFGILWPWKGRQGMVGEERELAKQIVGRHTGFTRGCLFVPEAEIFRGSQITSRY